MFLPTSLSKGGGRRGATKRCKQGARWEWPHLSLRLFWDLACRGIFSLTQKDLFLEKTGERSFSWKRQEKDRSLGKDRRKIIFLEKTGAWKRQEKDCFLGKDRRKIIFICPMMTLMMPRVSSPTGIAESFEAINNFNVFWWCQWSCHHFVQAVFSPGFCWLFLKWQVIIMSVVFGWQVVTSSGHAVLILAQCQGSLWQLLFWISPSHTMLWPIVEAKPLQKAVNYNPPGSFWIWCASS